MAGNSGNKYRGSSRLNTPRGNAGSTRHREHVSNVRGKYASLDATGVQGSWAERAEAARRSNEERARRARETNNTTGLELERRSRQARERDLSTTKTGRTPTSEGRAGSARVHEDQARTQRTRGNRAQERQLHPETSREAYKTHENREAQETRWQDSILSSNPADRLWRDRKYSSQRSDDMFDNSRFVDDLNDLDEPAVARRTPTSDARGPETRSLRVDYERDAERRTVQLGQSLNEPQGQELDESDFADNAAGFQDEYDQEEFYQEGQTRFDRVREIGGRAVEMARATSPRTRIIIAAVIGIIVVALVTNAFLTGGTKPATSSSSQTQQTSSATAASSSEGVEDPWVESKVFTTGDSELDANIKEFCDAATTSGASATENAYKAYLAVAWSSYAERDDNQAPKKSDWAKTYAKQWFASGKSGNSYEYAAVTQYVLEYFGYKDAKAEPCIVTQDNGSTEGRGLVLVSDITSGRSCVCDDTLGSNGWMLPADSYKFEVQKTE